MTDVWTSVGVIVGVGAVALIRWQPLDSIVAILVAINIINTGYKIVKDSVSGLMDSSISSEDLKVVERGIKNPRGAGNKISCAADTPICVCEIYFHACLGSTCLDGRSRTQAGKSN